MTLEDEVISAHDARRKALRSLIDNAARKAATGISVRGGKITGNSPMWKEKLTKLEAAQRILSDLE